MLAELTVKELLGKVAGSDPVPGGGSIVALNGAVVSALTAIIAGLTIGEKGYEEHGELMKHMSHLSIGQQEFFVEYIDRNSKAYDRVFGCLKLPKITDEEKATRSVAIQEATRFVVLVPMQVACDACELIEIITDVVCLSNRNTITDACVAAMTARPAILGALLSVRINLAPLKDTAFVGESKREACRLEQLACTREKELLEAVNQELNQ